MKKIVLLMLFIASAVLGANINVITDRSDFHIKPLVEAYENQTGDTVKVLYVKKGLINRAKSGEFDIMISKNGYIGEQLKELLVDLPNGDRYLATTSRVRGFFVRKGIDKPKTYADLVSGKYAGKICIRKLSHNYNMDLFTALYLDNGKAFATNFINQLKKQIAVEPSSNDRGQVKKIYEGVCDVSIGNSYYYQLMLENPEQKAWALNVEFVTPKNPIRLYSILGKFNNKTETNRMLGFLVSISSIYTIAELTHEDVSVGSVKVDRFEKQYQLRKEVYKLIKDK